jgi:hypothetical protein
MTAARGTTRSHAQAWIELKADDPEAISALDVARRRLAAGARLIGLRRMRLVELAGDLPGRDRIEALLHDSIQFYNPHKERCTVRLAAREAPPLVLGERVVLVTEKGGERRMPAERWWKHETGRAVTVREGTAWLLRLLEDRDLEDRSAGSLGDGRDGGASRVALRTRARAGAADEARALAVLRDARHGLFCNPHAQDARVAADVVPFPWLAPAPRRRAGARSEAS